MSLIPRRAARVVAMLALALVGMLGGPAPPPARADCAMGPSVELPLESPRALAVDGVVRSVEPYDGETEGWLYRISVDVTEVLAGAPRDTLTFSLGTGGCWWVQGDRFKPNDRLIVSADGQSGDPYGFLASPLIWRYEWGDHWTLHGFADGALTGLPRSIRTADTRDEILALVAPDRLPYSLAPQGWRVSLPRRSDRWTVRDVIAWRDGFVLVDARRLDDDGVAFRYAVRRSADGTTWQRVPDAFPEATSRTWMVSELAAFRDDLYALGSVGPSLAVWRSMDGRRWARLEPVDRDAATPGTASDASRLYVSGAAADATRMVVTGSIIGERTSTPVVWTTTDGQRWDRHEPIGVTGTDLADLTVGPDGFLARVCRCSGPTEIWQLITSPDGLTWHTVGTLPGLPTSIAWDAAQARYLSAGLTLTPDGRSIPEVHASTDGLTWTSILVGPTDAGSVVDVAAGGSMLVVVGDGYGGTDPSIWAMVSRDAGSAWSSSVLPRTARDSCEPTTALGSRPVVVGSCERVLAWTGTP